MTKINPSYLKFLFLSGMELIQNSMRNCSIKGKDYENIHTAGYEIWK
jgi:hypothetical protein